MTYSIDTVTVKPITSSAEFTDMKCTPKASAGRIAPIDHVLGPTACASSEPGTIPTQVPRTRSTD